MPGPAPPSNTTPAEAALVTAVRILAASTGIPASASRAAIWARDRYDVLVRRRNSIPCRRSQATVSTAPGSGRHETVSTPSMSRSTPLAMGDATAAERPARPPGPAIGGSHTRLFDLPVTRRRVCPMDNRTLGRTGIKVSPLCLGAMMFGAWGNPDHEDSIRIIHRALDAGINFVDTADVYSEGESEEIVAKALAGGRRDGVVLATKVHAPMGADPNMAGNSR